jgi:alpha-ketoglutarate-dependent taurine dioxygenase
VNLNKAETMQFHPLLDHHPIPLVPAIDPDDDNSAEAAVRWAKANAGAIETTVNRAGVVLVRGFEIDTPEAFRAVCQAIRPDLQNYTAGDSPRKSVADQVYTSSEYPQELEVLLHNELAYAGWSPDRVFFGCMYASETGGETHIADGRAIYEVLDPVIRDRFESRGIVYLQHLWDAGGAPGIGLSWQDTFENTDKGEVEGYLERSNMAYEWTDFGLRTRAPHKAVLQHPVTGEKCWHNQADQWHRAMKSVKVSFGAQGDSRFEPTTAGEETLGNHVVFGDGGEIDPSDLEAIREASKRCEVLFPWRSGDIMVIDNIMAMHGRKPFTGSRRILVAMA